jgi:aminoglycoside 6'-N-acetyltransferase I
MRRALWPGVSDDDMIHWLARHDAATLVAAVRGTAALCGFAEVGERPYADPAFRRQSVGASLIRAVEAWARGRGHRELASDTQLENVDSQGAHLHIGFAETERLVLYRKAL